MALGTFAMQAIPVEKINSRGAKAVWGMDLPAFDPATPIADSIASANSAVIIARYRGLDAHYVETTNIVKERLTGYGSIKIEAKEINRTMVKLLDRKAVETFADFEFGEKDEQRSGNLLLASDEEGFGVRVIKPDGTVNEIDLSEALPITDGKKGDKKKSYRIALPALEVGDVVDYFYYAETMREEFDMPVRRFQYAGRYPMLNYIVDCKVDPKLTVELRPFNGAPLPSPKVMANRNTFNIHAVNLPALPATKYINESRQVPFLEVRVLNNNSRLRYKPLTARAGGIYVLPPQTYYDDIADYLRRYKYESMVPAKAASLVKKIHKGDKEMSRKALADYTYLALMYYALIDENSFSPTDMAVMLRDTANKVKFKAKAGVGFINSSYDVPSSLVTSWAAPDYITLIDEYAYNPSLVTMCAPGEWLTEFHGEEGGAFRVINDFGDHFPEMFTIPAVGPNANTCMDELELTLDPDSGKGTVNAKTTAVGGHKHTMAARFNNKHHWLAEAERYLGIDSADHYVDPGYDAAAEADKLVDRFKTHIKSALGTAPATVDDMAIASRGVMPDAKFFGLNYTATFDDIAVDAGDEMIVNVGKFFADATSVEGKDRERNFDAMITIPNNQLRKLRIAIPEGYTAEPSALEALTGSVSNEIGSFTTSATLNDGVVEVSKVEQERTYVIPADKWNQFLELADRGVEFSSAALVLKKLD